MLLKARVAFKRILSRYIALQVAMLVFSAGFVVGCIFEAATIVTLIHRGA